MTRIEQIRERLGKATPGPWFMHDYTGITDAPLPKDFTVSCDHPAEITVAVMDRGLTATVEEARANATFIAHCGGDKGDVAYLLDRVERLTDALKAIAAWPDHDEREPANSMATVARTALEDQP